MASSALSFSTSAPGLLLKSTRRSSAKANKCRGVTCKATSEDGDGFSLSRRETLAAVAGSAGYGIFSPEMQALARPAFEAGDGAEVSQYLPSAGDGFFEYVVKQNRTPALRAEALEPYKFWLTGNMKELPVSNAISGNYCQPRCDEPTTEVKFGSSQDGSIQVIIAPLTKLTRLQSPTIDQIGDLEGVINSIGPYITGDFIEPDDVVDMKVIDDAGRKYFVYELNTPFALTGVHNLASVTTSRNELVMIIASASEKQWGKSENKLKTIVESLRIV